MPNILVTGGLGFIGSRLVQELCRDGHSVIVFDNLDETLYPNMIKRVYATEFTDLYENFQWYRADVSESNMMIPDIEQGWRPDVIIHLAAIAGVRPSLEDPAKYARVNVVGTTRVFDLAVKIGCPKVIYSSSSSVYGTLDPPFSEDVIPTRIVSPYALSKRQGELTADYYAREYGVHSISVRFFTVYGPGQRPDMFIRSALGKIHRGETLTLYGEGVSFRDYTYVDDIVNGLMGMIPGVRPGEHQIYNLGCGEPVTLMDLVNKMGAVVGKKPVVEHIEDQKGDVPGTLANIERAKKELGYAPETKLDEGLQKMWAWQKDVE